MGTSDFSWTRNKFQHFPRKSNAQKYHSPFYRWKFSFSLFATFYVTQCFMCFIYTNKRELLFRHVKWIEILIKGNWIICYLSCNTLHVLTLITIHNLFVLIFKHSEKKYYIDRNCTCIYMFGRMYWATVYPVLWNFHIKTENFYDSLSVVLDVFYTIVVPVPVMT